MSDLQELIIGSTKIIALRDGELSLPKEILLNVDDETSNKISDENNNLTLNNVNAYLILKDDKTLLVDTDAEIFLVPVVDLFMMKLQKQMLKQKT